jgi:hypothetical protein
VEPLEIAVVKGETWRGERRIGQTGRRKKLEIDQVTHVFRILITVNHKI